MGAPGGAREAALRALLEIDQRGAYASMARDRALGGAGLPERDRAFSTELIYGVTRYRKALDHAIDTFAARPVEKMDPVTRNALRLGAYQILHLPQVPPPAAVDECVMLARRHGHRGTAAFVNAVLRAMVRKPEEVRFPELSIDPVAHVALKHSHPEWMVCRWLRRFGLQATLRLCEANNERPPVTIRTNVLKTTPKRLLGKLVSAGFKARHLPFPDEAIEVRESGGLFAHALYQDGMFFVQDAASMLVAHVLQPRPGDRVLDLAAAPGGKAMHIAELMGDSGTIIAVDVHEHRVKLIRENANRLGIGSVATIVADARKLPPEVGSIAFDRVLVDAPCSGTGVLRRRVDLRWRREESDLPGLVRLQAGLLSSAAERVRPGGVMVYSTCSMEPEENSLSVSKFLEDHREFSLDAASTFLPSGFTREFPDEGKPYVETLPHIHFTDGFFIARLVRRCRNPSTEPRDGDAGRHVT